MPQTETLNRRFVLAERPRGEPTLATLRLETVPVPAPGPGVKSAEFTFADRLPSRLSGQPAYRYRYYSPGPAPLPGARTRPPRWRGETRGRRPLQSVASLLRFRRDT